MTCEMTTMKVMLMMTQDNMIQWNTTNQSATQGLGINNHRMK